MAIEAHQHDGATQLPLANWGVGRSHVTGRGAVVYVDDDFGTCKSFSRRFSDEFQVAIVGSATAALSEIDRRDDIAVVISDYQLDGADGLTLLREVRAARPEIITMLASAYTGRDVAIAAVNEAQVFRILEKPLEEGATRKALRQALEETRRRDSLRMFNAPAAALQDTLGLLAHELNTPLAAVRGSISGLRNWFIQPGAGESQDIAKFEQSQPGLVMEFLERAERQAAYCQRSLSTFVRSMQGALPGPARQPTIRASQLVNTLLREYRLGDPNFTAVTVAAGRDFEFEGLPDLLGLVLSSLLKNSLQALAGAKTPQITISFDADETIGAAARISVADNGPGIPAELLPKLAVEPVTSTKPDGSGLGLMFCQRVVASMRGTLAVHSHAGQGTTVTLSFRDARATAA